MTDNTPDLPDDVILDPDKPLGPSQLPELPPGYKWDLKITASADVIHPDGTVN